MVLKLKLSDGSVLFAHATGQGVRLENFVAPGTAEQKCVWAYTLTNSDAAELRDFLLTQKLH